MKRRCPRCDFNWPAVSLYETCPTCQGRTAASGGEPANAGEIWAQLAIAKRQAAHREFLEWEFTKVLEATNWGVLDTWLAIAK